MTLPTLAEWVRERRCRLRTHPEHRPACTGWASACHARSKGALGRGGEASEWVQRGIVRVADAACPSCAEWADRELDYLAAERTSEALYRECARSPVCRIRVELVAVGNIFDVCHAAHMESHRIGEATWEAKYDLDRAAVARELGEEYLRLYAVFA